MTEADVGWCVRKPRNAGTQETGQGQTSSRPGLRKGPPLRMAPRFQTPGPQDCEKIRASCFTVTFRGSPRRPRRRPPWSSGSSPEEAAGRVGPGSRAALPGRAPASPRLVTLSLPSDVLMEDEYDGLHGPFQLSNAMVYRFEEAAEKSQVAFRTSFLSSGALHVSEGVCRPILACETEVHPPEARWQSRPWSPLRVLKPHRAPPPNATSKLPFRPQAPAGTLGTPVQPPQAPGACTPGGAGCQPRCHPHQRPAGGLRHAVASLSLRLLIWETGSRSPPPRLLGV